MTSAIFFILFIPILGLILLLVNLLLAPHNPYQEKDSVFECGYHSFLGQNRTQFNVSFFKVGLIYLIFAIEIIVIYPFGVSGYTNDLYGLIIMVSFFIALTIGFVFEVGKNALSIDSRQIFIFTRNVFEAITGGYYEASLIPRLFSNYLKRLKDRCYCDLEWCLQNPPKPHAFSSLCMESGLYKSMMEKYESILKTQ